MDNYQKLEQLVNKTGCSYEDAKAALEACGWDMIDAVSSLEKDGKINKATAEQKTEQTIEVTAEIASEAGSGDESRANTDRREETDSAEGSADTAGKEGRKKREFKLWNRVRRIMVNNRMLILRGSGQPVIDVPIIAPVIALLLFFWATLGLAVLAMIFGFRFHFEGEDLGKTNINSTMDKATDYAEKVRNDLSGKTYDK